MKTFLLTFTILTILVSISNSYSQVTEAWVARYNGPGWSGDGASSIALDAFGNVYVTGSSNGDCVTIKYNSVGEKEWITRHTKASGSSIAIDGFGNVYVTGMSNGDGTGNDYATIKYNSEGIRQWIRIYNGNNNNIVYSDNDYSRSIAVDDSGNVYVTGESIGQSSHNYDYATIKYNSEGDRQWVSRYDSYLNNDYATSIALDDSGNVYVTGNSATIKYNSAGVKQWIQNGGTSIALDAFGNVYVTGSSNFDYVTTKYNLAGVQQWVSRYNSPNNGSDYAESIAVDDFGNVYVTGESTESGVGYNTIKYNSSGVEQWVSRYSVYGYAYSITIDSSGNAYVTGFLGSGTDTDYATIKYNSAGIQQWIKRYDGPGNGSDYSYSIAVDGLGNVYVTGGSEGSGTGNDCATIKYNSVGAQQWIARYNGLENGDDYATSIALDHFGNVYVTGYNVGSEASWDFATLKYNSAGVLNWVSRYNGGNQSDDKANSIALDSLGNVYVTGSSHYYYATIKYDSNGFEQWVQGYNGPGSDKDYAQSIVVDGLGNVYVTGSSSGTHYDYATIKYNSEGVQQWVVRYNGPGNGADYCRSIALDGLGNVYVTGSSQGNNYDYATIKYNSEGVEQWVTRYNGPANSVDEAYSLAVDDSGNVYVTGSSIGSGTNYDYATIKYNSTGVEQWVQRYNGAAYSMDLANSLVLDKSGNVYVTGGSVGNGPLGDYTTIKYNSAGIQQWVSRYRGVNYSDYKASSIALDGLGNVFVTGSSGGIYSDFATVKYNSEGIQQWVQTYNGLGNRADSSRSIAVDGFGNVYVTGESEGSITGTDYVTIKYSPITGIESMSGGLPEHYSLSQNFPNPFNPVTNINFSIPLKNRVELNVYNTLGEKAATLVNEEMEAGHHQVAFDASDLPSGVYFYRIIAGEFNHTKKLILLK